MNSVQGLGDGEALTIGDLAERTGVAPATLRMWEQRHGFPVPKRLESGHRRYGPGDVDTVLAVLRRRESGVRLDVAIEQAIAESARRARPAAPSVYAALRRQHPHLAVNRLRKSTLLALSWAIEDEFCAKAERAHIFGAFQKRTYYRRAAHRWRALDRVAASTIVFADFEEMTSGPGPIQVPLPATSPMSREWAVVCDAAQLPAALSAWELPGQDDVPDRDRVFESIWTVEPNAVREAARVCAGVAHESGCADATPLLYELAGPPSPGTTDLASVTTMFNRVVAYVDAAGAPRG